MKRVYSYWMKKSTNPERKESTNPKWKESTNPKWKESTHTEWKQSTTNSKWKESTNTERIIGAENIWKSRNNSRAKKYNAARLIRNNGADHWTSPHLALRSSTRIQKFAPLALTDRWFQWLITKISSSLFIGGSESTGSPYLSCQQIRSFQVHRGWSLSKAPIPFPFFCCRASSCSI